VLNFPLIITIPFLILDPGSIIILGPLSSITLCCAHLATKDKIEYIEKLKNISKIVDKYI
jgi:hypothetical protein